MRSEDRRQAVFGIPDGVASSLGLVFAMAAAHPGQIGLSIRALVVGSAISMAIGEWRSDGGGWRRPLVMGAATALGVAGPALPWLFTRGALAYGLSAAVVCGLGILIAQMGTERRLVSYAKTFGALALSVGLATWAGAGA
ncbi:MAG: hypothetical protein KGL39_38185 [Patescibacteria group bacterium]|nr:hypothetical protein [Patescibacteria group bacterium]